MSRFRRTPKQQETASDPQVLAVAVPSGGGFRMAAFRGDGSGAARFLGAEPRVDAAGAAAWISDRRAGRVVTAVTGAEVIVRAVQLPATDEGRLEAALSLNATTFVLGRTPPWRVASALLPGGRGDGIRTGLVVEWPEEAREALPVPDALQAVGGTFAPAVAALAALSSASQGPLALVDPSEAVLSLAIPTSKGLLVRTVRAGTAGGSVSAQDVALATGEACVHAGVPGAEIPAVIAATVSAAEPALAGGFGCAADDLRRIAQLVPDAPQDAGWWREHGLAAGIALAALGPAASLAGLHDRDPGKPRDRAGAIIARLSQPRTARRLLVAGLVAVLLGPMAIEGARLLLLRWKLPDLPAYQRAEDLERRRHATYRALARQGGSMTKVLSDIASCAPDGVEIEFINVVPAASGQSVTVRGKSRAAGAMPATEVLMEMERQLRESGAFEGIQRSSDAPDSRGYQEFSLSATAVRPTYLVAYPEAQDFVKKSMRERRYGPPPEDVDAAASGIEPPARKPAPGGGDDDGRPAEGDESAPAATAAEDAPAPATPVAASRPAPARPSAAKPAPTAGGSDDEPRDGTAAKDAATVAAVPAPKAVAQAADAGDAKGSGDAEEQGKEEGDGQPGRGDRRGGRASRGSGARSNLATRSNPGASAEPEPVPPPISENEVARMSPEEVRSSLARVAKARNERTDLDDATKERLKNEWNMLLDRLRSNK
jgi:hypothetical protein